jgi:hypothetical protein
MGFIFQDRRERAGLNIKFRLGNPVELLEEFLASASIRQLKILRDVVKGVIVEEVVEVPIGEKEREQLENITEVVKPPTEH